MGLHQLVLELLVANCPYYQRCHCISHCLKQNIYLQCPWGTPKTASISCSLADVMSEQLAKELQLEEENAAFPEVVA